MKYAEFAETLKRGLGLSHPPVALSFLEEPPIGIPHFAGIVPSACTFWRLAEERLFYAEAQDHYQCPVGTMTMGFELPDENKKDAEKLFTEMLRLQYLSQEEFPKIPSVKKPHRVVLYGPLVNFPISPDVVLIIALPNQAMILSEASGAASWTGPALSLLGRPTCGAIPQALDHQTSVMSSACIGARIYAELREEELVIILPGSKLEKIEDKLQGVLVANQVLSGFHAERKRQISGGTGSN